MNLNNGKMKEFICEKVDKFNPPRFDFPYLKCVVDSFDLGIMERKDFVIGLYEDRKFRCFITGAELDCGGFTDKWTLTLHIYDELEK